MTSIEVISSIFAQKQNEQILEYVAICHTQNMHIRFSAASLKKPLKCKSKYSKSKKKNKMYDKYPYIQSDVRVFFCSLICENMNFVNFQQKICLMKMCSNFDLAIVTCFWYYRWTENLPKITHNGGMEMEKETRRRKYSKGEGSISKRVKNGKTYWQGYVTIDFDENGKQIKETFSATSEKEAKQKRDEILEKVRQKVNILAIKGKTLQELVREHMEYFVKLKVSQTTFETYEKHYKNHIKDSEVGLMQVDKIQTRHLQIFIEQLNRKGLKAVSIKGIFKPINAAFKYAYGQKYIHFNPCEQVTFPIKEENTMKIFSNNQIEKLYSCKWVKENRLCAAFHVAMYGLRKSEILGLTWSDIDFENQIIYVNQQVHKTKKDGRYLGDLKTKKSKRAIPFDTKLLKVLQHHKARQNAEKLISDKDWNKENLVFCTKNGTIVDPDNFYKTFQSGLKFAGVEHMPVHSTRHTFCTRLAERNVNVKTIADLAGHTNIQTTARYMHPGLDAKREAIKAIRI